MIDLSDIEAIVESCLKETESASRKRYDVEQADKTAAYFLMAQLKLSLVIEEVEMKAKNSKNEITRLEGQKYFEYKENNLEKKTTENMIVNYVAKDPDIINAKADCVKFEASIKKYNYILNILKDGHVYFRNLTKNKTWAD